jgi:hypothetical protein
MHRPSREFAPAGDLLFAPPKSRQKALPCKTGPAGFPAMLERRGLRRTRAATLCSDNCAKSVDEALFERASPFCASRRFRRGGPEQPNKTAKPESRSPRGIPLTPFSPAEERKVLRPCAQRTSTTDSARLFEQSVAARVPGGASRLDVLRQDRAQQLRAVRRLPKDLPHASGKARRAPRSAAQGRGGRGELFAYFLADPKVGRPRGRKPKVSPKANPRMGLAINQFLERASAHRRDELTT